MILIADSGSTKTEWCIAENGECIQTIVSAGTNPYFQTADEIVEELKETLFPVVQNFSIEAVYFYGAGCAFPDKKRIIADILYPVFNVQIEVFSDLMAAARGLCGRMPGIACILGTGSNSCLYDGIEILLHTPSLGFILGDEGSGAFLGKRLVSDCLKRQLPDYIINKFMDQYELTVESILERIYHQPFPNRYLSHLSQFLIENLTEQPVYDIVYNGFQEFLIRNVKQYKGHHKFPIHFTGSIAHFYQGVLREATIALNMRPGIIIQSPMPGLINYHTNREE